MKPENEGPWGEADHTAEDDLGRTLYGYEDAEDCETR